MSRAQVDIRTYTCPEELSPLFDYESQYLFQSHFVATNTCDLVLAENHTQLLYPREQIVGPTTLLTIRFERRKRYPAEYIVSAWSGPLWRIIKELQADGAPGYCLKQGDELKLGQCILKVRKIGCFDQLSQSDFNQMSMLAEKEDEDEDEESCFHPACRLCLADDNTEGDPLLHPCRCTGSLKFIHLSCIQDWLRTQITVKEENGRPYSISWKPVLCEICHDKLPVFLSAQGQSYDLFGVECMSLGSYIIFEELNESTQEAAFHVSAVSEHTSLTIVWTTQGRHEAAGVTLTDPSVSLTHAAVSWVKGQPVIRDLESKFGTLARIGKSFSLHPGEALSVQVNRTVAVFRLQIQSSLFGDCFRCFRGSGRVGDNHW